MGFVFRCAGRVLRGAGAEATRSVSENSNMKFEFAVQDAIKTPKLKPAQPDRTRMEYAHFFRTSA